MIQYILNKFRAQKPQRLRSTDLAGVQYIGLDGLTSPCVKGIACLIVSGKKIKEACLLSHDSTHAFLLMTEYDEFIAVKSGFSSGYGGEGPRGLAAALVLLNRHQSEIDEYRVDRQFMERLEHSCLLRRDIERIRKQEPIRPGRWHEYVYDQGFDLYNINKQPSGFYPLEIPFAIIDKRIIDLAVSFRENEDASIISAYRRLEDVIRGRTGLPGEGVKLFSKAFLAEGRPLSWDVPDDGEAKGRGNLFNATYMAFRNARVHREHSRGAEAALREFLLINELYKLESEALSDAELTAKRAEEDSISKVNRAL